MNSLEKYLESKKDEVANHTEEILESRVYKLLYFL